MLKANESGGIGEEGGGFVNSVCIGVSICIYIHIHI